MRRWFAPLALPILIAGCAGSQKTTTPAKPKPSAQAAQQVNDPSGPNGHGYHHLYVGSANQDELLQRKDEADKYRRTQAR